MTILAILICGLAGWRLASLLVRENGPWDMFKQLRYISGHRVENGMLYVPHRNFPELLNCMWCCSVHTSAAMYFMYTVLDWRWPVQLIATMAIPIILEEVTRSARRNPN